MNAYTAPSNISEDYALRTKKKRFGQSNLLFDWIGNEKPVPHTICLIVGGRRERSRWRSRWGSTIRFPKRRHLKIMQLPPHHRYIWLWTHAHTHTHTHTHTSSECCVQLVVTVLCLVAPRFTLVCMRSQADLIVLHNILSFGVEIQLWDLFTRIVLVLRSGSHGNRHANTNTVWTHVVIDCVEKKENSAEKVNNGQNWAPQPPCTEP